MIQEFVIDHNRTKQIEQILLKRGVDYCNLLKVNTKLDIASMAQNIDFDIPGCNPRTVKVSKQIAALDSIASNPIKGTYTLGISSFPSDLAAKQLAIYLMLRAVDIQTKKNSTRFYPLWHKLFGYPKDKLRDVELSDSQIPSILILSNVAKDNTTLKVEKLRDLIEMYRNIPKIVVIGGIDPLTFFATKVHLPLTAGIYLGSEPHYHRKRHVV